MRELRIEDRTLEAYYGAFSFSQARRGAAEAKRLALDVVRQFNKYVLNPVMLLLAGRPHFYAGVIRHVGRRSGKKYATPIVRGSSTPCASSRACSTSSRAAS